MRAKPSSSAFLALLVAALVLATAAFAAPAANAATVTVFEFYNTTLKHYFLTAVVAEANAIDAGAAGPGWQRTGLNFSAGDPGSGPGNDVCRFYNPVANTHFYTAEPAECEQVKLPNSGWRYEELSFRIQLPVAGICPALTIPVYRTYNDRFAFNDSNHRLMTTLATYNDMIAQGWRGEGVVMCALNDGPLSDFNPAANATIGGTMNVANVTIPAGVTVTVASDLVVSATGTVTINGNLAGDCKAVGIIASGALNVDGNIHNHCATLPGGAPPALTLVGYGGYRFGSGGTTKSSGDVFVANSATLPRTDPQAATGGLFAAPAAKALRADYDCESDGRLWIPDPPAAANGANGGPTGQPGDPGRIWTLGCDGDGFINSTTVTGQHGGRGGNATHTSAEGAKATAGAGGSGALLLVFTTGQLDFGFNNFLHGGAGGRGGNATATSEADPKPAAAPPAEATAGRGGDSGTITVRALGGITIAGVLTLNVGDGGPGGNATVVAADGVDSTPAKAAQAGGTATGKAGDGGNSPDKRLSSNGNVGGLGSVAVTGGNGGASGFVDATGGKGGDGVVRENADGAIGGGVNAHGGRGGDANVRNLAGALVGVGGASGDAIFRRAHGGHGYNDCTAPLAKGGNGGKGGVATGGSRFGGNGVANGANGVTREIIVANGGNGGHGLGPGKRGEAGTDNIVSAGFAVSTPPVFTPGTPGRGCRFTITIVVANDPAPAHEDFVRYTTITILDALVDNDANTITFTGIAGGRWISVTGPYNPANGAFSASGAGTAAGIANVPVTFIGIINLSDGTISGIVTLFGSPTTPPNGLPGHGVIYNVTGNVIGVSPPNP